jgi:hypothetical protein
LLVYKDRVAANIQQMIDLAGIRAYKNLKNNNINVQCVIIIGHVSKYRPKLQEQLKSRKVGLKKTKLG